jgi:hypothetical protein
VPGSPSRFPKEENHAVALAYFQGETRPWFTTDYVVDETLTLLRSRGEDLRALSLGDEFFAGALAKVHHVAQDEVQAAWQVFRHFHDKDWSFTDCTSKVIIEKLGLTTSLTFDHHFRQFGSVIVVP